MAALVEERFAVLILAADSQIPEMVAVIWLIYIRRRKMSEKILFLEKDSYESAPRATERSSLEGGPSWERERHLRRGLRRRGRLRGKLRA